MAEEQYSENFPRQGVLEKTPLPKLIALLLESKMTGILHMEADGAKHWIFFEEGFPASVHAPKSQDFLGVVLRELNFIDDAAFNMSLMEMAKSKRLQGQILLEAEAIDEQQLERALSLQLARKLTRLFNYRKGKYQFVEGEEAPPPHDPIRVNPYGLIYNGIKNTYDAKDLKEGLMPLMGKSCRVSRLFVERGELFEFPPDDLADAKLLQDFRLPQDFVRGARSGATAAMMMLISLLYCNMLELDETDFAQPMPGVKGPRPKPKTAPAPARAATAQAAQGRPMTPAEARKAAAQANISAELKKKIDEKFKQVKTADLYAILEVPGDADFSRVQKAYITLAKVYHPDRVAGSTDEEIKHRMGVIFSQVNEAYQTLTDSGARVKYDKKEKEVAKSAGPSKGGAPRPEEAKIQFQQFQKAMIYIKKHDLLKAVESVRWACDMDPENGDYKAYRIWLDYQRSEDPEEKKLGDAKADMQAVYKTYAESFWAARLAATLFKKADEIEKYGKALMRASRLNSKHHDTTRELRLFRTREQKRAKEGRFLGIKFKRD
ncbi:MAG: DnaJ domain-containing protein [Deltaproteobacteria bacterium]|nr:DnaJ domain-containing protein [Deltaproteobacteria bacterium]